MINIHQDITLIIDKLQSSEVQFVSFRLEESALGSLPKCTIVVRCDVNLELKLLDKVHIKLIDSKGNVIEGDMYAYEIAYVHNEYTIKLLSQNKEFIREPHVNHWTNYKNAVRALYPSNLITNHDTDLLQDMDIYQMRETDYKLVNRLLQSWKKNAIYGFALDAIRIHDLDNYWKTDAFKEVLGDVFGASMLDNPKWTDPKQYSMNTKFIDYSKGVDPNHSYVEYDQKLLMTNNMYKDLIANYLYNLRFATTKNVFSTQIRTLIPVHICDGVEFPDAESKIVKLWISSRTIFIDTNTVTMDFTLRTIQPEGESNALKRN